MKNTNPSIEKLYNIQELLAQHFSSLHLLEIRQQHVCQALYICLDEKHKFNWPVEVWNVDISYGEALLLLSNFDFKGLTHQIETEAEIIPSKFLMGQKLRIKSKGIIWVIHRYDVDPFPSNPHAHQLESNIKLDLSSGKCFIRKQYVHTIKKKDLIYIRGEASKVYELPPLLV